MQTGNIWITPASIDKGTPAEKILSASVLGRSSVKDRIKRHLNCRSNKSVYRLLPPDLTGCSARTPPALVAFSVVRNKLPNLDLIPFCTTHMQGCKNLQPMRFQAVLRDSVWRSEGQQGCNIALSWIIMAFKWCARNMLSRPFRSSKCSIIQRSLRCGTLF